MDNETSIKKPPFYIRWFFPILVLLGFIGGAAALWIPSNTGWLRQSGLSGEAEQKSISDLRLHFLYITGGIIAILTLLQTSWKNQVDRRKVEADIQKNEQDAKNEAAKREQDAIKSERDHTRQVHAERRSRYTTAVEQLANKNAPVRLGGIYTLVGLVDEWLADDSIKPEEQKKEGQVIINNLCSYIRSPFPLAEKIDEYEAHKELEELESQKPDTLLPYVPPRLDALHKRFEDSAKYQEPDNIAALQAAFHEEQDVRRTVFVEMSKRSSTFIKNKKGDTDPRIWSDFTFDFSRAPIFYPLNNLTIEKGNFSSAKFYSAANFGEANFGEANFGETMFTGNAHFLGTKFTGTVHFEGAKFTRNAHFKNARFTRAAEFRGAEFTGNADFKNARFTRAAEFRGAEFTGGAYFGGVEFTGAVRFGDVEFTRNAEFRNAKFVGNADFRNTKFIEGAGFSKVKFTRNADFKGTKFTKAAGFWDAEFIGNADFRDAEFIGNAEFRDAEFIGNADFRNTKFTENTDFKGTKFTKAAGFWDTEFIGNADFRNTEFIGNAYFQDTKFTGNADFKEAKFIRSARFSKAKFTSSASFDGAYFEKYAPAFTEGSNSARFSDQVNWTDSNFSVLSRSQTIQLGSATLDGKTFKIPVGTVLFDPDSWDEEKQEYTRVSASAKPLDNLDEAEENKSEQ